MSPVRSSTYLDDQVDAAVPGLSMRVPEKPSADLPLRNFTVSPVLKKSDDKLKPESKPDGQRRHSRSASADVQRPPTSDRRRTTGDKLVMSRSKGDLPVVRRIQSSYGPKPATVEDADDMESTLAVDSEGEGDFLWEDTGRISSTTFIAKTPVTTEIGKVLSGSPGEEVDPVFLEELTQHESQHNSPEVDTPVQPSSNRSVPIVIRTRKGHSVKKSVDRWSSRSHSSHSSIDSGVQRSPAETVETTPDPSISGDFTHTGLGLSSSVSSSSRSSNPRPAAENDPRAQPRRPRHSSSKSLEVYTPGWRYGTPEMSRGQAKLPVLSPNELQPRPTVPGLGHPKHLPRAEKLPVSGYELLASKLSAPGARPRPLSAGLGMEQTPGCRREQECHPQIKPIYRRFEALNHRLLLHLQDELSELEEHLHRLDTADTQTRRTQSSILPASRRAESVAAGELQWHKTDILTKIGAKLEQYNQALASFSKTQQLPSAKMPDVETYRSFLSTHNPIAEIETRFLDTAEDLVSLSKSPTTSRSSFLPSHEAAPERPTSRSTRDSSPPSSTTSSSTSSTRSSPSTKEIKQRPISTDRERKISASPSRRGNPSFIVAQGDTTSPVPMSISTIASKANEYPVAQAAILASLAGILPILLFRILPGADFTGRMVIIFAVGVLIAFLRWCLGDAGFWIGLAAPRNHEEEKQGQQDTSREEVQGQESEGKRRKQHPISASSIGTGDIAGVVVGYAAFMSVVALIF